MKVCTKCGEEKPKTDFHKSLKKPDGLQVNCKACRKLIDAKSYLTDKKRQESIKDRRDRNRKANQELMQRYKKFCGCMFCSEREPIALDLHHTDPNEKDMNPSSAISYSRKVLKAEIRKCVVLCANCHRKVHAGILTV